MSYQEIFSSIEDVWMEKKNISQHVMNDGGVLKDVSFFFFEKIRINS